MNLIRKFRDQLIVLVNYDKKVDKFKLYRNALVVLKKSVIPLNVRELQHICQDLIDFGFNSDTGKIKLHFSRQIDPRLRDILFKMLYRDGKLRVPVMKDKILFRLDFDNITPVGGSQIEFLEILEEVVNRIEGEFNVTLHDEILQYNIIIRQNNGFILKTNIGLDEYIQLNINDSNTSIPQKFILAFRLKNEYS